MNQDAGKVQRWLAVHGVDTIDRIEPVNAGLGMTTLWRIRRAGGESDLLARVFPPGTTAVAEREEIAMRAAAKRSVPVPDVVRSGTLEDRPVLLTTWAPGKPARQRLRESPGEAQQIGRSMGEVLGRLHQVTAPSQLVHPRGWIDLGGASLAPLRAKLAAIPHADRLLHLDYHAENVLIEHGNVTAVIDWANARPGPSFMDLARSQAIVQAAVMGGIIPGGQVEVLNAFIDAMADGHDSVMGPDPHPELSAAWGMAMTVDDLAGHLGNPESWVTVELLAQLQAKRDALIAGSLRATGAGK